MSIMLQDRNENNSFRQSEARGCPYQPSLGLEVAKNMVGHLVNGKYSPGSPL